jgi:hypothetical protein
MVFIAEIIVDWLKHAFITRFNEIPSSVYREYTLSLAYDLAQTKQKNVNLLLFTFIALNFSFFISLIDYI